MPSTFSLKSRRPKIAAECCFLELLSRIEGEKRDGWIAFERRTMPGVETEEVEAGIGILEKNFKNSVTLLFRPCTYVFIVSQTAIAAVKEARCFQRAQTVEMKFEGMEHEALLRENTSFKSLSPDPQPSLQPRHFLALTRQGA